MNKVKLTSQPLVLVFSIMLNVLLAGLIVYVLLIGNVIPATQPEKSSTIESYPAIEVLAGDHIQLKYLNKSDVVLNTVFIKENDSFYPILNPVSGSNYQGVLPILGDNLYLEGDYVVAEIENSEFGVRVALYKLSKDSQHYVGRIVRILNVPSFQEFSLAEFLEATADDRCDQYYNGVDFVNYSKEQVQELILKGCVNSTMDTHSSDLVLYFAGGRTLQVKASDIDWIESTFDECTDNCKYLTRIME